MSRRRRRLAPDRVDLGGWWFAIHVPKSIRGWWALRGRRRARLEELCRTGEHHLAEGCDCSLRRTGRYVCEICGEPTDVLRWGFWPECAGCNLEREFGLGPASIATRRYLLYEALNEQGEPETFEWIDETHPPELYRQGVTAGDVPGMSLSSEGVCLNCGGPLRHTRTAWLRDYCTERCFYEASRRGLDVVALDREATDLIEAQRHDAGSGICECGRPFERQKRGRRRMLCDDCRSEREKKKRTRASAKRFVRDDIVEWILEQPGALYAEEDDDGSAVALVAEDRRGQIYRVRDLPSLRRLLADDGKGAA